MVPEQWLVIRKRPDARLCRGETPQSFGDDIASKRPRECWRMLSCAGDLGNFISLTGAVRLIKLPAKQSKRLTISGTLESASEPRLMLF
jgi:hypothetical protein